MKDAPKAALQELTRLANGFRASRVILTANNLGLFDQLTRPLTAEETARLLRTDPRATEILLDAVTSLGIVKKSRNRYRITAGAAKYLVAGSPQYQGDMLRHTDTLWKNWANLDDVIRTGRPSRSGDRRHDVFIRAMHNNALPRVRQVLSALELRGVRRALDLGGGPGTYSIALARKGIKVTLFDLPDTLAAAQKIIRAAKATGVSFRTGDFHFDDIGGPYNLVLLSQILHSHSPIENRALLAKAFAALAPGGTIAVHEFMLDEDRAGPVPGALFAVNMLVNTGEGRSYTPGEIRSWLTETGCGRINISALGETVLVTGKKSTSPGSSRT